MDGLFAQTIGFFKGFSESGLEFAAEIVAPYHTEFRPMLGEFILVAIDRERAALGRITRFFPAGVMSGVEGDEYLASLSRMRRQQVPEDLKEAKLRYSVRVKLLGSLSNSQGCLRFHPSVRELPHLGALVGTPRAEVVNFICQLGALGRDGRPSDTSGPIGHLATGEVVFDGNGGRAAHEVLFDVENLVGKRTYVFARAGYGKSNLIKLLTAQLYSRRATQDAEPVGMLIFDPEGEYAWRDSQGRPGLADVPELRDRLVVYSDRRPPPGYERWLAGRVRLDLSRFRPADIVNICIAETKQEYVFANLLRGLRPQEWSTLLKELHNQRYRLNSDRVREIVGYQPDQKAALEAIPNNVVPLVDTLHDPHSRLDDAVLYHLRRGRIVVVDVSLLGSRTAEQVAGLLLRKIFDHNQAHFTGDARQVIPAIAVVEEAQSVLSRVDDRSPFVEWVKEGRKYRLGCILVTQQPGSIAERLLSQGDNFFAFHLISAGDLEALKRVNAHYSDDVLMQLLNEPIRGNAYLWCAPSQPFVLSARILNFEQMYPPVDGGPGPSFERQTPVEEYRQTQDVSARGLDEAVRAAVLEKPTVVLRERPVLAGQQRPDLYAVHCFNLCAQVAELLGDEDARSAYCEQRGAQQVAREDTVEESLLRLGLLADPPRARRSRADQKGPDSFFLLEARKVETKKSPKPFEGGGLTPL